MLIITALLTYVRKRNLMSRPIKCRKIDKEPDYNGFEPNGIPCNEIVLLSVDEFETIRLIDLEKMTQEECSIKMEVSRTTVTALYENARFKIADSLVNGKRLIISGGKYKFSESIYDKSKTIKINKGVNIMRIAVTYEKGEVFQHFGHTENFKFYDVENKSITNEQVVNTQGQGHGALATFLSDAKVDVLICGGIGGGAQTALAEVNIKVFGGVSGSADEAVTSYLNNQLQYNPNVQCNHSGNHSCSSENHSCNKN